MSDHLETRVQQFRATEPDYTWNSHLISDLWAEVQRLRSVWKMGYA